MRYLTRITLLILMMSILAACNLGNITDAVPTTGDTANDAAAAGQYLPNLAGYTSQDATSITSAITAAGGGAALVTGNVPMAALAAQLDNMISCYRNVGAVAARIYTENNVAQVLQGNIPKVGALAILNQDRLLNNFVQCALSDGGGASAQSGGIEPCAGAGSFTANNQTYHYIYAATNPELCTLFQQNLPAS